MQHLQTTSDNEDDDIIVKFVGDASSIPNIVKEVCLDKNWIEFDPDVHKENDWNLQWKTGRFRTSDFKNIKPWQRLNHQPASSTSNVTCKDGLLREMKIMQSAFGKDVIDFVPTTFLMPREERQFKQEFVNKKEKKMHNNWIFKPADKSRGRGIFVFNNSDQLRYSEKSIVQEYITNPLLIGGYKFDLRLYAVVVSFRPLVVYLCSEGLVRFGTEKYDLQNLCNVFSHLTNTSINVGSAGYDEKKIGVGSGCKWSLTALRNYFYSHGIDDRQIFAQIVNIVILTLLAQSKGMSTIVGNCYELYGFDIILDSTLKPWLLEVNYSPALSIDCATDDDVKRSMLNSLFDMLCFTETDKLKHRRKNDYKNYRRHHSDDSDSGISSAYSIRRHMSSRAMSRADSIKRSESRSSLLDSIDEDTWEAERSKDFLDSRESSIILEDYHNTKKRAQTSRGPKKRVSTSKSTPCFPELFTLKSRESPTDSDIDLPLFLDKSPISDSGNNNNDNLFPKVQNDPVINSNSNLYTSRKSIVSQPVRSNRAALLRNKQAKVKMLQIMPVFKPKEIPLVIKPPIVPIIPTKTRQQTLEEKLRSLHYERVSKYGTRNCPGIQKRPKSNYHSAKRSVDIDSDEEDEECIALDTGEVERRQQLKDWKLNSSLYGEYPINDYWKEPPKQFGNFSLIFPFNKTTQVACKDTRTTDRLIVKELQKLIRQKPDLEGESQWSVDEVWPPVKSIFS